MAWVVMGLILAVVVFILTGIKTVESSTVWQPDGTPKKLKKWKINGKQFLSQQRFPYWHLYFPSLRLSALSHR